MSLSESDSRLRRACWMELKERGRLGGEGSSSSDERVSLAGAEELAAGEASVEFPEAAAGFGASSAGAASGGA